MENPRQVQRKLCPAEERKHSGTSNLNAHLYPMPGDSDVLFDCCRAISDFMKLATVVVIAGVFVVWSHPASADQVSDVANAIRIEATRSNDDPEGRPLPLATHWSTGSYPVAKGRGPAWQIRMIEQGHHLLPWFQDPADNHIPFAEYYEAPLKKGAATEPADRDREHTVGKPALAGTVSRPAAGEKSQRRDDRWKSAPESKSLRSRRAVARGCASWTNTAAMKRIQQWYPDHRWSCSYRTTNIQN